MYLHYLLQNPVEASSKTVPISLVISKVITHRPLYLPFQPMYLSIGYVTKSMGRRSL